MTLSLHVGLVPLARPTFDVALAREMVNQMRAVLQAVPGVVLHGPDDLVMDMPAARAAAETLSARPLDLALLFQATFADSTMAGVLADALQAPLLLWAVPEARTGGRLQLNSFCGINLAGHSLRRAGFRFSYAYAPLDDPDALQRALRLARAGRVARLLKAARIGRYGRNPDGFEPCTYDEGALATTLGVQVEQRELAEVFSLAEAAAVGDVEPTLGDLRTRVAGLEALDQPALRKTLGSYLALRRLADAHGYAGLAVRCWPEFFTELGCAACGALSLLTDEGTPCSCEADVNGTITQLILQWLSGGPAFGTDVVGFDLAEDVAVLWHCGLAPLAMADPQQVAGVGRPQAIGVRPRWPLDQLAPIAAARPR